jgi:hypothetical protein
VEVVVEGGAQPAAEATPEFLLVDVRSTFYSASTRSSSVFRRLLGGRRCGTASKPVRLHQGRPHTETGAPAEQELGGPVRLAESAFDDDFLIYTFHIILFYLFIHFFIS